MKKAAIVGVVIMALVLAIAATAYGATTDNGTVNVSAQSNSKLTLTLSDNAVDFGDVDPGSDVTQAGAVTVTVNSNKAFSTTKLISDNLNANGDMGLSTTGFFVSADPADTVAKGAHAYDEDYTINIPWDTDPGLPLTASVLYTALQ